MGHLRHLEDSIHYTLLRPLAEGGMGCVYEAQQKGGEGFTKRVAIKLIREQYSAEPAFRKNFVGEARLVSDLIHNSIVQTYHLGELDGQYYMVMELVDGINLEEFILQHRALQEKVPIDLACFIVARLCRGLSYAHQKRSREGQRLGIVHRDVNPRNVLLSFEGDVKLTDFGIAKAVDLMYNDEGSVIAGKDEYLSPEQARREVTDARADLFSCGVVLAEMLCGYNIFEEPDNGPATRRNIIGMPLPDFRAIRSSLPRAVVEVLERALARDRRRRYQTAWEMLRDIESYLYAHGYGPSPEKLATYLNAIFLGGKAYEDDLQSLPESFGLPPSGTARDSAS